MLLLLLYFAAAIAVLIQLKLKRTWVKFLVGFLGGFCGSIVLGVVLALILESTGNPQLGKDIGLVGLKSCLGTSIATIIFLFVFQLMLKRWKRYSNSLFTEIKNKLNQGPVYFGLCIAAWLVGLVAAHDISMLIGGDYAEATIPVIIGFWAGKLALKNKSRDLGGIVAFPIVTLVSSILGYGFGNVLVLQNSGSTNFSALISMAISFVLSCALFFLINRMNKYESKASNNASFTQNYLEEKRKELQRAIKMVFLSFLYLAALAICMGLFLSQLMLNSLNWSLLVGAAFFLGVGYYVYKSLSEHTFLRRFLIALSIVSIISNVSVYYISHNDPLNNSEWKQRVDFLRQEVATGKINQIPSQLLSTISIKYPMSTELAKKLESTQTWWKESETVYIYIENKTPQVVSSLGIEFSNQDCAIKGNASRWVVAPSKPIAPNQQAVLSFPSNEITNGCLTITSSSSCTDNLPCK